MAIKQMKAQKKQAYDKKLCSLLDEYSQVLIATADNVGSNQLQNIRNGLRGDSVVLMGKNTLIRRCIRFHAEATGNHNYLNLLLPLLVGNVGLIFTKGDLKEVSEAVAKYKMWRWRGVTDLGIGLVAVRCPELTEEITKKCLPQILQLQHLEELCFLVGCNGLDGDGFTTLGQGCKSLENEHND